MGGVHAGSVLIQTKGVGCNILKIKVLQKLGSPKDYAVKESEPFFLGFSWSEEVKLSLWNHKSRVAPLFLNVYSTGFICFSFFVYSFSCDLLIFSLSHFTRQ